MKRRMPSGVIFAIALFIAALLPLYVERTMTELMFADGSGGAIKWGWKRCTLREFCSDYPHMAREQTPPRWLGLNIALALAYSGLITFPLNALTKRVDR